MQLTHQQTNRDDDGIEPENALSCYYYPRESDADVNDDLLHQSLSHPYLTVADRPIGPYDEDYLPSYSVFQPKCCFLQ
jgi:hypothetical protein